MRPPRLQPTKLPRPWDSPGKNTGVGCHCLLQRMKVKSEREVSRVRLFTTPWTAAYQPPPSMGFPGKSTGVGCHFLLQCMKVKSESEVAQSCPTLSNDAAAKSLQSCPTPCDPIDGSPPGSPVPGILQARTLEWVAISFSNAGK